MQTDKITVTESMVYLMSAWLATRDGYDEVHQMFWTGCPPEPWGEVWMRYEDDARNALGIVLGAS